MKQTMGRCLVSFQVPSIEKKASGSHRRLINNVSLPHIVKRVCVNNVSVPYTVKRSHTYIICISREKSMKNL